MIRISPATLGIWLTILSAVGGWALLTPDTAHGRLSHPVPALAETASESPLAAQQKTRFIRYSKGRKIQRLETAIVEYHSEDAGLQVSLVSAVHIGDKAYYKELSEKLKAYPHVLYEGLKEDPENPGDALLTLLDRLQNQLKDYLALEHQNDHLSTKADNFVHADLSAKDVQKRLKEAEISLVPAPNIVQSMGPLLGRLLKALEPKKDAEPSAFLSKIRDRAKRSLAQILGDGDAYYQRFKRREEEKRDAIIIEARNEHALEELDKLREDGKVKKVAILYGAGHMNDFETRLKKRYPDLSLRKVEWVAAWTIGKPRKKATPPKEPAEEPAKSPPAKKI